MNEQPYWTRTDVDTTAVRNDTLSALLRSAERGLSHAGTLRSVCAVLHDRIPLNIEVNVTLKQHLSWFDEFGSGGLHVAESVTQKVWRLAVSLKMDREGDSQQPYDLYVFSLPLPRETPWWNT